MVSVILLIILDWIFVSMNATAMRFPVGMSNAKLINFRIFFSGKNISVVAVCLLNECAIILMFIYMLLFIYELQ